MDIVLEPEAISILEIVKLSGYEALKRGSKNSSIGREFGNTGWPQIYIIHVSAYIHNEHELNKNDGYRQRNVRQFLQSA